MRHCGECTLCCKLEKVPELAKPRGTLCSHCAGGCKIHETKPKTCAEFACYWLKSESMPNWMRPDIAHLYIAGDPKDGYLRAAVDPLYSIAWREGYGARVIDVVQRETGAHVVVQCGHQVNFIQGHAPMPERLLLDWAL